MTRAHLIHGFNVADGGNDTVSKLLPYLAGTGLEVVHHNYGWVGLIRLRWRNEKATINILKEVKPGDILIGHSNGCLICWELVEAGASPGAIVCIQPALRRDTVWPDDLPILCLYNPDDWVVSLGRMWGRFISVVNPFRNRHGWGAAGRYGFNGLNEHSQNVDTSVEPHSALGHSTIFDSIKLHFWGKFICKWIRKTVEDKP